MNDTLLLPEGYGDLGINVQRPAWRTEINLHTTPRYLKRMHNLRNNHETFSCYFCGFPDGPFLEIHHLDHDHENYQQDNLKAVCTLCHRLQHLGWVGIKSQGKLIHLPSDLLAAQNSPDGSPAWSLEVFNLVQRFYLMSSYLSAEQQKKLESLPLKKSIQRLLDGFKRRNFELSYNDIQTTKAERLEKQKELQDMNKEQKDEYFKEQLEKSKNAQTKNKAPDDVSFLSGELHIIDLVDALCEEYAAYESSNPRERARVNPTDNFFATQKSGTDGRLTVWFNQSVFEPFESNAEYTLKDRLDYYNDLDYFSPQGITRILHTSRESRTNEKM
ncbi:hypothetical protein [Psychrobacter sp. AOP31-A1-22]|uniref:hypothetical protein n=1 Tax=Psychrobacter sp. AOP31-A1-22 TaxID=3457696 RepID=UPI00403633BF